MTATLHVESGWRVGALGRQGSGKTELMRLLLADQPRVLIVDSKHRVNFPGYFLTESESAALIEPRTIFRPKGGVKSSFWEDALVYMNEKGGGVIYIDELAEVSTPNKMDKSLQKILRLGRELGVGLWWSAQSATEIFNTAIRQTDVMICFLNIGASDRDKMTKTVGDLGEVTAHLELYDFVVFESANQSYDPNGIRAYRVPASMVENKQPLTGSV